MPITELIDIKKLRKAGIYLLCVIVTLGLQNMLLARISLLGVHALIMPALVLAIGFYEGGIWGAALGLVAGWLSDLSMLDSTATYMVVYAVIGFGGGFLTEFFINRRFFSYMLLAALSHAITAGCQIVPLWIFRSTPLADLLPTVGLQILWSTTLSAPTYFAVKAIALRKKAQ